MSTIRSSFITFFLFLPLMSLAEGLEDYYLKHKPEIANLRAEVLDDSKDDDTRLASFNKLRARFSESVPEIASEILTKEVPDSLELAAVRSLAAHSVMSDHIVNFKSNHKMTPGQHENHQKHEKILRVLAKATHHENKDVRLAAAKLGGSLSDKTIIDEVELASAKGLFSGQEVVSIVSNSNQDLAIPILRRYIEDDSVDLSTKVAALKASGKFQTDSINLERYAVDTELPAPLRIAAIQAMSGDINKMSLFATLSLNESETSEIAKEAADALARTAVLKPGSISTYELRSISNALESSNRDKSIFFNSIRTLERVKASREQGGR